ncbi:MAG TPA: ABC transporter permease [Acidobacteriaceae bacterium]|nr:ABC transporter permease [Acidobacteriaceae bacterium]
MARVRNLWRRGRVDAEIEEELHAHIEMVTEDGVRAGMSEEEARRAARVRFGNPVVMKERTVGEDAALGIESLWRDVKFALRQMKKSPGFAATAVLTLALGIGGVTAVFSVVYAVLLRPLPFPQASRLVVLHEGAEHLFHEASLAAPDVLVYQRNSKAFTGVAGFIDQGYDVTGAGEPFRAQAERVSAQMFPVLGSAPLMGRTFTRKEDENSSAVMVLSYALWKERFGGRPDVIGKTLDLDLRPYTIIGVMPRGFETPTGLGGIQAHDLWVPLSLTPVEKGDEADDFDYGAVGRLKAGVTMTQALGDAQRVLKIIQAKVPEAHLSIGIRGLKEQTVADARPLLRTLLGAVVLILLIACANLANLLLVRAAGRRREFGVRMALGAARRTMLRQLLIESLLLSAIGGAAGLGLAAAAVHWASEVLPDSVPRLGEIAIHWPVALLAAGLVCATAVACGMAPALASTKAEVLNALREGGQTTGQGRSQHRLRSALVVAEMALAMLLLVGAGLLLRSFARMTETDPGFQPEKTVTAYLALPSQGYPTQQKVDDFFRDLGQRLAALPGVKVAGFGSNIPVIGRNSSRLFAAQGYVRKPDEGYSLASNYLTAGEYFQALGIQLIEGRYFNASDDLPGAPLVAIISQSFARKYFAERDPLGMHIKVGPSYADAMPAMRVVGVVGDVSDNPVDRKQDIEMYEPVSQVAADLGPDAAIIGVVGDLHAVVRTAGDAQALEGEFRQAVRQADPLLAVTNLQTMEEVVSSTEAPRRFNTWVLTAFAGIALALALLGIYGVLAYSVTERRREIAIRMALGATRADVERRTLGDAMVLGVAGVAVGLAAALGLTRYLASLLYKVKPLDGLTLMGAVAVLLACATLAGWLPARRAAGVDPMEALRGE